MEKYVLNDKKDKEESGSKIFFFEQESAKLPQPIETKSSNSEDNYFVKWGADNKYPSWIYNLYQTTGIFSALINNLHDYVLGDEIIFAQNFDGGDDLHELVDKITLDYCLLGMCAIQRLRSPLKDLKGLAYVDMNKLRAGRQDGKPTGYYSQNWSAYTKNYVTIPIDDEEADSDILILKSRSKNFYSDPFYSGAIKSIATLNAVDNYHFQNVNNGFSASYLINMNNGVPTQEERQKIEKKIQNKWSGDNNAGKFVLAFNENKDNAATIEKVPEDNLDKKFDTLYSSCKENLILAFRCPSQLVGSTLSANAFNNIEYQQAFKLYSRTVVYPIQKEIIRFLNRATGIENFISIKPFKINFDDAENESSK